MPACLFSPPTHPHPHRPHTQPQTHPCCGRPARPPNPPHLYVLVPLKEGQQPQPAAAADALQECGAGAGSGGAGGAGRGLGRRGRGRAAGGTWRHAAGTANCCGTAGAIGGWNPRYERTVTYTDICIRPPTTTTTTTPPCLAPTHPLPPLPCSQLSSQRPASRRLVHRRLQGAPRFAALHKRCAGTGRTFSVWPSSSWLPSKTLDTAVPVEGGGAARRGAATGAAVAVGRLGVGFEASSPERAHPHGLRPQQRKFGSGSAQGVHPMNTRRRVRCAAGALAAAWA